MTELEKGTYQHFKGGIYELVDIAKYSEDPDKKFVIYKSKKTGELWVRPLEMWDEEVEKPEYDYKGPRFKKIEDEKTK